MKKRAIILCFFQLIIMQSLFPQNAERFFRERESNQIDGTHLLEKEYAETAKFLRDNPDYFYQAKLKKTTGWNFTVGTRKNWYTHSYADGSKGIAVTTCRGVGEKCYIFVEDSEWGLSVDQVIIDSVMDAFDRKTPANPTKGIYETTIETFGNIPDVDNDPRIIIVLLDIKDGRDRENGFISGYFNPACEVSYNFAEMFFIDPVVLKWMNKSYLQRNMRTLVHEFQHMIHWNYHKTSSQLSFIDEGCATVAPVICGYSLYDQTYYISETNRYLLAWRNSMSEDVASDYSRAARFTLYFYDQFGANVLKHIVQTTKYGMDVYSEALNKIGSNISISELLLNWFIANNLDDKAINPSWGYKVYPDLPKAYGLTYYQPNIKIEGAVENYAVEYITFKAGENLNVRFASNSSALKIKAIKVGNQKKEVIDIPLNVSLNFPEFGSSCSTITFAVMNPTGYHNQAYECTATGESRAIELRWDVTETGGYLKRSPLDTICVCFDAVKGGRLDSIKVAAGRKGTLTGAVYQFTGVSRPSPLGNRSSEFFTAYSNMTPEYPYPVPYPNWLKIDISSQNIKTDNPFAVAFGVPQDTSDFANIMSSTIPGSTQYHNYTYIARPEYKNWYYIGSSGVIYLYHIRAYVSIPGVTEVVELNVPNILKLEQNYPNPFNPVTKISYSLKETSKVSLKIFDILGREVETIVNEIKTMGNHSVAWQPKNLAGGVYYYRISANGFNEVKKMMYIR